ncbi:CPK2 [Symbiodinium sp. CCMP2456]|nr:CPK2 [Symbiodinium sp. CCMP2456]
MCSRSFVVQKRSAKSLNRYQIGDSLGAGCFGTVAKATDKVSGVRRAFKTVSKEAAIMALLDHPNICRLYDVIDDKEYAYFVMELCSGGDLQKRLEGFTDQFLPEPTAASLMKQLFSAMNYLHQLWIAHGDFAARNVLIKEDKPLDQSMVKVADFGSARSVDTTQDSGSHKSDIWGLGRLMRGLVCDISRVLGKSTIASASGQMSARKPMDDSAWLGHSDESRCLCGRILRRDPAARWTAEEALHHPWLMGAKMQSKEAAVPENILQRLQAFANASCLERIALQAIAEQRGGCENLFVTLDKDADGLLTPADLQCSLEEVFGTATEMPNFHSLLAEVDPDGVGVLELSTFKAAMLQAASVDKRMILAGFRVIDKDMDGKITARDLLRVFPELEAEEASSMVAAFDLDCDGGLNSEEFSDMVQSYFHGQTAEGTWPKTPLKRKTPEMRRFKLFSMSMRNFRTVDDDDNDAHSSCVASSIFTTSNLAGDSRLVESSSSSSSGGDEENVAFVASSLSLLSQPQAEPTRPGKPPLKPASKPAVAKPPVSKPAVVSKVSARAAASADSRPVAQKSGAEPATAATDKAVKLEASKKTDSLPKAAGRESPASPDDAEEVLQPADSQISTPQLKANSKKQLGHIYLEKSDMTSEASSRYYLELAARACADAVAAAGKARMKRTWGQALLFRGRAMLRLGRRMEAWRSAVDSSNKCQEAGDGPGMCRALLLAGEIQIENNDLAMAMDILVQAQDVAELCSGPSEFLPTSGDKRHHPELEGKNEAPVAAAIQIEDVAEAAPAAATEAAQAVSSAAPAAPKGLDPVLVRKAVMRLVKDAIADDGELEVDSPFMEAGMDSLSSVALTSSLAKEFGFALSPSLVFDFPNVRALEAHLVEESLSR